MWVTTTPCCRLGMVVPPLVYADMVRYHSWGLFCTPQDANTIPKELNMIGKRTSYYIKTTAGNKIVHRCAVHSLRDGASWDGRMGRSYSGALARITSQS